MFYYSFHINDYRAATAHLTNGEDLAYRRLLDLYYENEGPLLADSVKLARLARSSQVDVETVLGEFFVLEDGKYRHGRGDRELQAMVERAEVARNNGSKGGRPRKRTQRVSPANPVGTQREPSGNPLATQSEPRANPDESYPITPVPQDPSTPTRERDCFMEFWEAYDFKKDRPASMRAWAKIAPDEALAATIVAKARETRTANPAREFYRNPATWLNARGWEDEIRARTNGVGPSRRKFLGDDNLPELPEWTPPPGMDDPALPPKTDAKGLPFPDLDLSKW